MAATGEYMHTSTTFGAPMAPSPTPPHRIDAVKMQLELGSSMTYFASMKLGEPAPARRRALSPAKVGLIEVQPDGHDATVTVTPDQLSLAIGKGGQNVRLAAKLTGFKIDLRETAAISDLDAAMQQAMEEGEMDTANSAAQSAFDALFKDSKSVATASPDDVQE